MKLSSAQQIFVVFCRCRNFQWTRSHLTLYFLSFPGDKARKETKSYLEFYKDYGFFFKEGIITSNDQYEKEEIAKLLRFESSSEEPGKLIRYPCLEINTGGRRPSIFRKKTMYVCNKHLISRFALIVHEGVLGLVRLAASHTAVSLFLQFRKSSSRAQTRSRDLLAEE